MEYVRKNDKLPAHPYSPSSSGNGSPVHRREWIFALYDVMVGTLGLLLFFLYFMRKFCTGNRRRGINQRFGFYPPELLNKIRGKEVIWIHAVSVGETKAAVPLIRALRHANPDTILLLSNVTENGHSIAVGISELNAAIYAPFDFSKFVKRSLSQICPRCILILESEIWPNFIRLAHASQIPVFLVNGRVSDRSFPRYRKMRIFFEPLFQCFTGFCMQTAEDAERILQLGASREKVEVTHNLKFDFPTRLLEKSEGENIRRKFGYPRDGLVFVAGSTHGGEEEIIFSVYKRLRQKYTSLYLSIVPRHPERSQKVADFLKKEGFSFIMRSRVEELDRYLEPDEVLIGDTLGEMLDFYICGDLIFVGGSLARKGGHNLLEPVSVKKPVLFGPYVQNFREISRDLIQNGAGVEVMDCDSLYEWADRLFADVDMRQRMGEAGHAFLSSQAGAAAHTLSHIEARTFI